jgi:hypothetical protein
MQRRLRGHRPQHVHRLRLALAVCGAIAMTCATARSAHADEPVVESAIDRADRLFREGQTLMEKGDAASLAEACARFDESHKLDPKLGRLLNLATCHERQSRTATAYAEFREAAAWASQRGQELRVQFAKERAADLAKRLSLLRIVPPAGVDAASLEVTVDGETIARPRWSAGYPIDPGPHALLVRAPGKREQSLTASVTAVGFTTVTLAPFVDAAPLAPTALERRAQPAPSSDGSSRKTWAIVIGGAGLVAAGLGGYFGAVAIGKRNDADPHCPSRSCDPTGAAMIADARNAATSSTVLLAVGGAAIGAGITLFVWPTRHSSVGLTPIVGPNVAMLRWEATFP